VSEAYPLRADFGRGGLSNPSPPGLPRLQTPVPEPTSIRAGLVGGDCYDRITINVLSAILTWVSL